MTFLLLVPTILSFLVLAAHYLREWNLPLVALCLAMPLLLFIRQRYTLRAMQVLLLLAAWEWGATAWDLVQQRMAVEEPFLRGAVILLSVAGFNLVAGALFQTSRLKNRYAPLV